MKKKYVVPAITVFLILISAGYLYNLHSFATKYWGFVIGDWFINFNGGFVRRGLSGYLIMLVSDFFHLKPCNTLIGLQSVFYLAYVLLFFLLFYGKKLNAWFMLSLLSPATLLFTTFDPNAAGRKEIILFFIYVIYLWCLEKDLIKSNFMILLFSLALLIGTMFHELMFFYTPYFMVAAYLHAVKNGRPFYFFKSLWMIAGSWIVMLPILVYGSTIDGYAICSVLKDGGLPDSICLGILSWPQNYGWKDVAAFAGESNYIFVYGTTFFLSLIPFILQVKFPDKGDIKLKKFILVFGLLIVFSIPLFILAVDWGRWINIHFMLLLFTSTIFLKKETDDEKLSAESLYVTLPAILTGKYALTKRTNDALFFLMAFAYISLWSMPHFGYSSVFSLTKNFYSVKHMITDVLNALF